MRRFARSHPALTSAVFGLVFGLVLFAVGGWFSGGLVNIALAVIVGGVFGASMYWASTVFRRPPPD
jgi:Mg/Co/Ni transporter MgtE